MKVSEVEIGMECYTRIGQSLARVQVVGVTKDSYRNRLHLRFIVKRVGEQAPLPKHRSAAALHRG